MGIQRSRTGLDLMQKKLQNVDGNVRRILVDDLNFIAEQGAQEMQQYIRERGTAYSEYRYSRGQGNSAGREDTGTMLEAVGYTVTSYKTRVNAEVGWLEDFKKYFDYQERGTRWIEPMYALRDASATMRDIFKERGAELIARALRAS